VGGGLRIGYVNGAYAMAANALSMVSDWRCHNANLRMDRHRIFKLGKELAM